MEMNIGLTPSKCSCWDCHFDRSLHVLGTGFLAKHFTHNMMNICCNINVSIYKPLHVLATGFSTQPLTKCILLDMISGKTHSESSCLNCDLTIKSLNFMQPLLQGEPPPLTAYSSGQLLEMSDVMTNLSLQLLGASCNS